MSADIITLPTAPMSINSPSNDEAKRDMPRQWTDEMRRDSNSRTFLRMEKSVRDAALMACIVEDLMVQAEDDEDDEDAEMEEHLVWGVMHLVDMVKHVRDFYLNQGADQAAEDEDAT